MSLSHPSLHTYHHLNPNPSMPFHVHLHSPAMGLLVAALVVGLALLRRAHGWAHERRLGKARREMLPPGDMGWPVVGNMWGFLRAFKSGNPDGFINSFVNRFSRVGMYRAFMFNSPTILVTTPETCKQVLMDDEHFIPGWPAATCELVGKKSFVGIYHDEHRRLRKMTAQPITGFDALSSYLKFIEETVVSSLDKWTRMGKFEYLTELRRLTFTVIMHIFLSSEKNSFMDALERTYTDLNYGMRAMAINLPGFAYHKALKARKKLVAILQSVLDARRIKKEVDPQLPNKDMMDDLIDVKDENGRRLSDEEIIDILVMYLNAGHESTGHIALWTSLYIQENPDVFRKAKEEQSEIRRNMPPTQKGLTLHDVRKMEYLSKVIDETLRAVSLSFVVFRQATEDVKINGYLIPKGWKVQVWLRSVHMDPEVYPDPKKFDPSRWDGVRPRPGTFLPFGGGGRLCPGNELAKLEISVLMHYFLLDYELIRLNPHCPIRYLPHPRPTDNCMAEIRRASLTT